MDHEVKTKNYQTDVPHLYEVYSLTVCYASFDVIKVVYILNGLKRDSIKKSQGSLSYCTRFFLVLQFFTISTVILF